MRVRIKIAFPHDRRISIGLFMYARILHKAAHIRRFTITATSSSGWEVREEEDSQIIKSRRYHDWHRVERARWTFAVAAADLRDAGWVDA